MFAPFCIIFSVPAISHPASATLMLRSPPLRLSVPLKSSVPPVSRFVTLTVSTTPELTVVVVVFALPSRSSVATAIVVFAVTVAVASCSSSPGSVYEPPAYVVVPRISSLPAGNHGHVGPRTEVRGRKNSADARDIDLARDVHVGTSENVGEVAPDLI